MKTPLPIEKHASTIYTLSIFYNIQKEICTTCFNCRVLSVREDGDILYYEIKDGSHRKFTLEHNVTEKKVVCSCKMFEIIGLLCSHTFMVFKDLNFDKIPLKYVLNLWTKGASLKPIFHINGLRFYQSPGMDERKVLLTQLWGDMQCCIGLTEEAEIDKLIEFAQVIKKQKLILMREQADLSPTHRKNAVIESYCESSKPSEISILPPRKTKNKGSGKHMKGKKELAMDASKKGLRKCHTCDVYIENDNRHDSRNCPLRKELTDEDD
ncbi:uncharacterized protein LOC116012907 [Ipomoea triloba]|uniref:uncharacterized protein LOC116012907 n=1 Tax=Ipomoea triloba TaxID=35885 RepID=UPI00125CF61F|nr:uncharacterized protein LOC116012907 [Ipomoea triloba]